MGIWESVKKVASRVFNGNEGIFGTVGSGLGIGAEFTDKETSDALTIASGAAGIAGAGQGLIHGAKKKEKKDWWGIASNIFGGISAGLDTATGIAGLCGSDTGAGILRMISGGFGTLGGIAKGGGAIKALLDFRKKKGQQTSVDASTKDKAEAWKNLVGAGAQIFRGITNIGQGFWRMQGNDTQAAQNWAGAGKAASIALTLPGLAGNIIDAIPEKTNTGRVTPTSYT